MERHSVPQNIMDVEFKLFGSLTVRQFANLAICIVSAVLVYFFNIPAFIKWPIIILLVMLGLALALVKINGQSFGTWMGNFIVAMFTSQRKIWRKSPKVPEILTKTYKPQVSKEQIVASRKKELPPFLREDIQKTRDIVDSEEEQRLKSLEAYIYDNSKSSGLGVTPTASSTEEKSPVVNPSEMSMGTSQNPVQEGLYSFPQSDSYAVVGKSLNNQNPRSMRKTFHKNLATKVGALDSLVSDIEQPSETTTPPLSPKQPTSSASSEELLEANKILQERIKELTERAKVSPNDKSITDKLKELENKLDEMQSNSEITGGKVISQKPNVISGVVASKNEEFIPEVRVLIKDKRGYLVRSLVTDSHGYFVTTTSLPDGDYFIELESSKYSFDRFKVTLDGRVKDIYKFSAK